ncbi:hypothetical protein PIB30_091412 [Stylosanthes scabra]|uniref:Uncharacterized protein n=1 Tax=Stylosanthes scabra TaxID=79078 RepID=A0ABU6RV15_9FABA|nr:hypothetical protein [Stylosanthes scabra]
MVQVFSDLERGRRRLEDTREARYMKVFPSFKDVKVIQFSARCFRMIHRQGMAISLPLVIAILDKIKNDKSLENENREHLDSSVHEDTTRKIPFCYAFKAYRKGVKSVLIEDCHAFEAIGELFVGSRIPAWRLLYRHAFQRGL